jgi:hypothetical protein
MKLNHYYAGVLAAAQDCHNYGDLGEGMNYDGAFLSSPLPADLPETSRSRQLGERFALRAFRDHDRSEAIDLIASRLWKWGAETELDAFLEAVGMDREGEPTPVQDRPALRDRLSRLWSLDRNGWAATTDGSLDELSDAEIIVILDEAIASILAEEDAA